MINVTLIRGSNPYAAAHYFSQADDYYAKDSPGQWQGRGAQSLGLSGDVDARTFRQLMAGHLPNGQHIGTGFDREHKRRMAIDLTFSAPKSVSMQALVAGDRAVTAAHDTAVQRALDEMEKLAEARRKVDGQSLRERTGNLVIARFRHEMSRAKDPQLHTHAVVLNMTQRADGAWRALANEDLFRVQHQLDAIYKAELADGLQRLGYGIRVVDDTGQFELAHITRAQLEAFSARSAVIEQALAEQGKTRATATALEKQVIALATRPRKDERDRAIVKQYWLEKSAALGIDYARPEPNTLRSADGLHRQSLPPQLSPAQAVVQYAINHLTEREAVVTQSELTTAALQRAVGLTTPAQVRAEIERLTRQGVLIAAPPAYRAADDRDGPARSEAGWVQQMQEQTGLSARNARQAVREGIRTGRLCVAEARYTTHRALQREQAILAMERQGRDRLVPLVPLATVRTTFAEGPLNAGQRAAVEAMVSTGHRFVGVQGDAGTGKTFTVNQAVHLLQRTTADAEQPVRTVALAPYGSQVKALREEGLTAHTLASFLRAKDKPLDARTLVILDEAGVVNARQMAQVMRLVEKAGARMVLLGDTKQTEAIEAGRPFAQLQQAGMTTARISQIQRQRDVTLRTAVEHAAGGRVGPSLEHIRHVAEIPEPATRHRAIAEDFVRLSAEERRQALIVAGTNAARREINALVREGIDLAGKGREFTTLTRIDLTQAQRRFAPSYRPGMAVLPERDYTKAGLVRGQVYRVVDTRPGNGLVIEAQDGTRREINPRRVTKLSVYQLEKTELSVGDTVRITRNDAARDLTNGDRMQVIGVHGGVIRLEGPRDDTDGRRRQVELPSDQPLHLEHAYATTVHSAQGLTSERAFIALDTKSRTTSMNLYYVAISRARTEARIYTDEVGKLPEAISRRYEKSEALQVLRERRPVNAERQDFALQRQTQSHSQQLPCALERLTGGRR